MQFIICSGSFMLDNVQSSRYLARTTSHLFQKEKSPHPLWYIHMKLTNEREWIFNIRANSSTTKMSLNRTIVAESSEGIAILWETTSKQLILFIYTFDCNFTIGIRVLGFIVRKIKAGYLFTIDSPSSSIPLEVSKMWCFQSLELKVHAWIPS